MTWRIALPQTGGAEVLTVEETKLPAPAADEVRVRHEAVGLNFIDTYHRSGLYPLSLPSGIGLEAAGVITDLGADVAKSFPEFSVGTRVAYAGGPLGAYADERNIPARFLVPIPAGISCRCAALVMLKGLTAAYLLRRVKAVQAGDTVLIHAAAGGVGTLAGQWAKSLGARVIGTVGSAQKIAVARSHGYDEVIDISQQNLPERVRQITDGAGVDVVYDGIGRSTFMSSLDCLRRCGLMVSFGNASGAVAAFDPLLLTAKGSLFFTRPALADYTRERADLLALAGELFALLLRGKIQPLAGQHWALRDVVSAHRALENRQTQGSSLLLPD